MRPNGISFPGAWALIWQLPARPGVHPACERASTPGDSWEIHPASERASTRPPVVRMSARPTA